jgi:hypothetical protein
MNHKFWNAGGGKPEGVTHAVKNLEAVKIQAGTPAVFAFNGTDDGLGVILPSSTTAAAITQFTAGAVVKDIEPGKLGEVQVYGFFRKALVARGTRAATNAAWASMPAIALGATLGANSLLNGFDPAGVSFADQNVVLAEAIASATTLASTVGSGTVYYTAAKTFLRFM